MQVVISTLLDGIAGTVFYWIGRIAVRMLGIDRSRGGHFETLMGFAIVVGIAILVFRLPAQLLALAFRR